MRQYGWLTYASVIFASIARPQQEKNISLTHVNEAFNEKNRTDFKFVYIDELMFFVLNIVEAGYRYGARVIETWINGETIM